ncbi:hypothetical protein HQ545_01635 [Candidatus Woesearchaeota archaeon]|nr:hypothetical protein [Candidatus Woesearchaeota archaeon]
MWRRQLLNTRKVSLQVMETSECTEPGCRYPAVKNFHGKLLCQDCYERYKDQEERANQELRDMG